MGIFGSSKGQHDNLYIRTSKYKLGDEKLRPLAEKEAHANAFYDKLYNNYLNGTAPQGFTPNTMLVGQVVDHANAETGHYVSVMYYRPDDEHEIQQKMGNGNNLLIGTVAPNEFAATERLLTMTSKLPVVGGYILMSSTLVENFVNRGKLDEVIKLAEFSGSSIPPLVLNKAVENNDLKLVKKLVEELSMDVNAPAGHAGMSPLHKVKTKRMFDYLVSKGADVLYRDAWGDPITHNYGGMLIGKDVEPDLLTYAKDYIQRTQGDNAQAPAEKKGLIDIIAFVNPGLSQYFLKQCNDALESVRKAQQTTHAKFDIALRKLISMPGLLTIDDHDAAIEALEKRERPDFTKDLKPAENLSEITALNEAIFIATNNLQQCVIKFDSSVSALIEHLKVGDGYDPDIARANILGFLGVDESRIATGVSPLTTEALEYCRITAEDYERIEAKYPLLKNPLRETMRLILDEEFKQNMDEIIDKSILYNRSAKYRQASNFSEANKLNKAAPKEAASLDLLVDVIRTELIIATSALHIARGRGNDFQEEAKTVIRTMLTNIAYAAREKSSTEVPSWEEKVRAQVEDRQQPRAL